MALSSTTLSTAIKTEIKGIAGITIEDEAELEKFTEALATAIVDHLTSAAVPTGQVVIPSGSSAGTYPLVSSALT